MTEEFKAILELLKGASDSAMLVAMAYFASKYLVVGLTVMGCFAITGKVTMKIIRMCLGHTYRVDEIASDIESLKKRIRGCESAVRKP